MGGVAAGLGCIRCLGSGWHGRPLRWPVGALKCPVVQTNARVGFAGLRHAKARPRYALVVHQALALHIGQRGVRKQQLLCRKGRRKTLRNVDPRPKKRHLKPPEPALRLGVPCDVPPLGAQIRMAAVVAWKHQRACGQGVCGGRHGLRSRQQGKRHLCGQPLAARGAAGRLVRHGRLGGWKLWHQSSYSARWPVIAPCTMCAAQTLCDAVADSCVLQHRQPISALILCCAAVQSPKHSSTHALSK